jgi:hypothetical protein
MWGIINMLIPFWSAPGVLFVVMPAVIVAVLLIMDQVR